MASPSEGGLVAEEDERMTLSSETAHTEHGGVLMGTDSTHRGDPTFKALLGFIQCLGARPRHEIYFSTPITSGETFVHWRRTAHRDVDDEHPDYRALHYEHVVAKNLARVRPLVASLRIRFPDRLVVDPTELEDVDGWAQPDYHDFWCAVIARYAAKIVFANGWQYSNGCVAEFATAVDAQIPMYTEDLNEIHPIHGIALVDNAIAELQGLGEEPSFLRSWLATARESLARRGERHG